jgi:hypothetical protein
MCECVCVCVYIPGTVERDEGVAKGVPQFEGERKLAPFHIIIECRHEVTEAVCVCVYVSVCVCVCV